MLERKGVVTRNKYSLDSDFEKLLNYSRVVDDGEWVFISGCSGFDYTDMTIAESMTEQTQQVFSNTLNERKSRMPQIQGDRG